MSGGSGLTCPQSYVSPAAAFRSETKLRLASKIARADLKEASKNKEKQKKPDFCFSLKKTIFVKKNGFVKKTKKISFSSR